jgi:SAM-dependent methyltransferase
MADETPAGLKTAPALLDANRAYYDSLWSGATLVNPERFNTWPLVQRLAAGHGARLEIAPGLRPRLPIEGTQFLDISSPALRKLQARGASVVTGLVTSLPFGPAAFDLVCALDIVEHVSDEGAVFGELERVLRPGGTLLLSVPLHPSQWTPFDDFVGHCRRYEPAQLWSRLDQHGFAVQHSAVFGMQPKSSRLLDLGHWYLTNRREQALWWYNRAFMPLGLRFQKKLHLVAGKIDTAGVDEILLVCRKAQRT